MNAFTGHLHGDADPATDWGVRSRESGESTFYDDGQKDPALSAAEDADDRTTVGPGSARNQVGYLGAPFRDASETFIDEQPDTGSMSRASDRPIVAA